MKKIIDVIVKKDYREEKEKRYYLVISKDGNGDDCEDRFTNKRKAIAKAKLVNSTDIMVFYGTPDNEMAKYVGQVEVKE